MAASDVFPVAISPLLETHADNSVEQALYRIFCSVFEQYIREKERDVNVSGMPHLGSFSLVSRHVERDGLALVNKGDEAAMRYLFRAWKARNPKRGLHFIKTYLQLLWKGNADVYQMWQDKAHPYPTRLYESERENTFLTSRLRVVFNDLLNSESISREIQETAPALRSSIALRFVLEIYASLSASCITNSHCECLVTAADADNGIYLSAASAFAAIANGHCEALAVLYDSETPHYSSDYFSATASLSSRADSMLLILEN